MHSPTAKHGKGSVRFAILIAATLLSFLSSCERSVMPLEPVHAREERLPVYGDESALGHQAIAIVARNDGNYAACSTSYVLAAKASPKPADSAVHWYSAARCSARAGNFSDSLYHLHASAVSGFALLPNLMTEPLFRPLYDRSRWNLVVDLIAANQRAAASENTTKSDAENQQVAVCQFMQSLGI